MGRQQDGCASFLVDVLNKTSMRSLATTSKPMVGSSRKSSFGLCSKAAQIFARMRCPRDRALIGVSMKLSSSSSPRNSSRFAEKYSGGI